MGICRERFAILQNINSIESIGNQMPQQLKHQREISQIKVVLRLISKHLIELESLERSTSITGKTVRIDPYVEANTRIKNHIMRKGLQIKRLTKDEEMKPYALGTMKCMSAILEDMELV